MSNEIRTGIQDVYGAVARGGVSGAGAARIAEAFGYSQQDLASIPEASHMGLSCGNPTAMASLKPGETVLDLGSGGGLDVFLAAQAVGPAGKAIGIDMTADMVDLARRNAEKGGYENVEFHLSTIEDMPLADGSVDCVISNCVLNLVPDKDKAFAEIFRVLKSGGRLAVSDIALKKPLPDAIAGNMRAWIGCIAGAISFEENRDGLLRAGFSHVDVIDAGSDLNAYKEMGGDSACCAPPEPDAGGCCAPDSGPREAVGDLHGDLTDILNRVDINEFAASVKIFAIKA